MNKMQLKFLSRSENEVFARNVVAAFALPLEPTLSELSDVKTAVSEAVTNCIVHAYEGEEDWVLVECELEGNKLHITVSDSGKASRTFHAPSPPFIPPARERSVRAWALPSCRPLWMNSA